MNNTIDFMKELDNKNSLIDYFVIASRNDITDLDTFISIFHNYLYTRKIGSDGYKIISTFSFNEYISKYRSWIK